MAKRFTGTAAELQERVGQTGVAGEWEDLGDRLQFRSRDGAIVDWWKDTHGIRFQGDRATSQRLSQAILGEPEPAVRICHIPSLNEPKAGKAESKKVFVVHGHDALAREQTELVLHKLGLEPYVLANTGGGGLTLIEALEREITHPSASLRFGIVIATPDDMAYEKTEGEKAVEPRARQNVILELGMLIAAIGRSRVAVLMKGHVVMPSDVPVIYIRFNDHVKETVPKLADRLREAGFDLEVGAITKASS